MGTFGKTTIGGTSFDPLPNEYDSSKYVLSQAAVIKEMWAYCACSNATDLGVKLAIYTDSAGLPVTFKGATNELTITAGAAAAWRQFTIASPFSLTAGTYHLGFMGYTGVVGTGVQVFGDSPGGNLGAFDTQATGYPNFDNPATTPSLDTVAYSIYAVFDDAVSLPGRRSFPLLLQKFRAGMNPFPFAFPTPDDTYIAPPVTAVVVDKITTKLQGTNRSGSF